MLKYRSYRCVIYSLITWNIFLLCILLLFIRQNYNSKLNIWHFVFLFSRLTIWISCITTNIVYFWNNFNTSVFFICRTIFWHIRYILCIAWVPKFNNVLKRITLLRIFNNMQHYIKWKIWKWYIQTKVYIYDKIVIISYFTGRLHTNS